MQPEGSSLLAILCMALTLIAMVLVGFIQCLR